MTKIKCICFVKKIITFQFLILFFFLINIQSFSAVSNSNREILLAFGYPQEFVASITDTMCEKIVLSIGDNEVKSVEYGTDESAVGGNVVIKKITALLGDKQSGGLTGKSVCVYWEWKESKPLVRCDDKITVGWDKNLFSYIESTFYAEDYYKSDLDEMWVIANSYNVLSGAKQGSLSHYTEPKKFSKYIGGSIAFNLSVADSENENYNSKTYVSYEHVVSLTTIIIPIVIFIVLLISVFFIRRKKNCK